jgi:hypothetical protein
MNRREVDEALEAGRIEWLSSGTERTTRIGFS